MGIENRRRPGREFVRGHRRQLIVALVYIGYPGVFWIAADDLVTRGWVVFVIDVALSVAAGFVIGESWALWLAVAAPVWGLAGGIRSDVDFAPWKAVLVYIVGGAFVFAYAALPIWLGLVARKRVGRGELATFT
jgi:hypothetical protein